MREGGEVLRNRLKSSRRRTSPSAGWTKWAICSQIRDRCRHSRSVRFEEVFPYNGHLTQARRKGNELWALDSRLRARSTSSSPTEASAECLPSKGLSIRDTARPDERAEHRSHRPSQMGRELRAERWTPQSGAGQPGRPVAKVPDRLLMEIERGKEPGDRTDSGSIVDVRSHAPAGAGAAMDSSFCMGRSGLV